MAAQIQGGPNMDQFEAFFQRADLDRDGRISGAEAVSFLQGSNLPKQVLAQIWMHADQSRTGYLSRPEFYNALKLVTVAQSKRELTADIVKAALYGPASAKIPAPQINLAAVPAPQSNPVTSASAPQMGAVAPTGSQNLGFRGKLPPNLSTNQQYFPSQVNLLMRPPLQMPTSTGTVSRPPQSVPFPDPRGSSMASPVLSNTSTSSYSLGGRTAGATSQIPNRGIGPSMPPFVSKPEDPLSTSSFVAAKDPKASMGSGNGFGYNSMFGSDIFSANQSVPQQTRTLPTYTASSASTSSAIVPVSTTTQSLLSQAPASVYTASSAPASSAIVPVSPCPQSSVKSDPFESLQSSFSRPSIGVQPQEAHSLQKPSQQTLAQTVSSFSSSGMSAEVENSTSNQSQLPWPKMTRAGVQKYTKVFMEVDNDRDGRITGEQARNLFLSWRLPREVLKQVWDLSDQDSDSMLSLREFCIALYLMERHREGRELPPTLPNSVMLDETLLSLAGQPTASYGSSVWGAASGFRPHQGMPGSQPNMLPGLMPQMQPPFPQADGSIKYNQDMRMPFAENSVNNLSNREQHSVDVKDEEEKEKKVEDKENVLLDSKEKIEFYRTKMQDLVLYKSRCDNRLNEITERALVDKQEAELLGKKYEEKYKQVAEIASRMTIEEASFREIQERKMELQQALVKIEQGGSADGILQVRADRIQSDVEELLKALTERCKKNGINVKSTALIELPPGWQPGIPEVSAVWDEDWDKFEDKGFSFDVAIPATTKSTSRKEISSPNGSISPDLLSNADGQSEKTSTKGERGIESESAYTHSEDESTRSPIGSPARQTVFESPSKEYSDNHFRKSFEADTETHSFDEQAWGAFNNNDDTDSDWGFNSINAKDSDHEKHGERDFFESSNMGLSPIKTDSPESGIQQRKSLFFEDSVPATPLSRTGNSPSRYSVGSRDPFFDNMSSYDSFSMHDNEFSSRRETFTRFDSISSSRGFDYSHRYSFDDSDPFGSSGPLKVSYESNNQKEF